MKCYNHHDKEAMGICKSCQKGLCTECIILIDGSISCKGECQEDVATLNYMVKKGRKVYKDLSKQWSPAIFIHILGGLTFIGFGLIEKGTKLSFLLISLGIIFLITGVLNINQRKRMSDKNLSK